MSRRHYGRHTPQGDLRRREGASPRGEGHRSSWFGEALVLVAVCAAPWMFGSTQAWAELLLLLVCGLVAVVAALWGRSPPGWRSLTSPPSLALGGLVLLALAQAAPLPPRLMAALDPGGAELRRVYLPAAPERVLGDSAPPVPLPPATLSQAPGETADAAARLAAAWLLFQGVVGLGGGYTALRRFAWVVAANGAALALFAVIQALTWNGRLFWTVPVNNSSPWSAGGPFVSHTHLAEYLNLCLGLALGLALGARAGWDGWSSGRSGRFGAVYLAGVLACGVMSSRSRGGFLGMLAGLAVIVAGQRAVRRPWLVPLAAVAVLLAALMFAVGDADSYVERLRSLLDPAETGYRSRVGLWRDVLGGLRDYPVWGTGLGTFGVAADRFVGGAGAAYWKHGESVYVELLVEGGAVGLALALACLAAVVRRVGHALKNAGGDGERALVLGGCAGGAAVLTQFLSDFGLYVPGVAVPLVALYAHLCGVGATRSAPGFTRLPRGMGARLAVALSLALATAAVTAHGLRAARAEAAVAAVGLPLHPDMVMPGLPDWSPEDLRIFRDRLRLALELKPDWAEGYLWAGLTELALYRVTAEEWLTPLITDPAERDRLTDPLWLAIVAQGGPGNVDALLGQEPVRQHILPAARHFLEARRRAPVTPLAHAELGALAWALDPPAPASAHLRRALRSAGPHPQIHLFAAQVAVRTGDMDLAAVAWQKALKSFGDGVADEIAEAAGVSLASERILDQVIPTGRPHLAVRFADVLYSRPKDRGRRMRFLRWAVERIPAEYALPEAERLHFLAEAWAGLGERVRARDAMTAALAIQPDRFEWRSTLIEWELAWGDAGGAHDQAVIGVHLSGGRPEALKALEKTAEAFARGGAR